MNMVKKDYTWFIRQVNAKNSREALAIGKKEAIGSDDVVRFAKKTNIAGTYALFGASKYKRIYK